MKLGSPAALCCWNIRRQPVMAYAAGGHAGRVRALSLFPRTTFKKCLFYRGIQILMAARMDATVCSLRESAGDLLSAGDLADLLGMLKEACREKEIDWLLTWPAQTDRKRLYLIFRAPAGRASGVVKIGGGEFNCLQFRNEADTLTRLSPTAHPFSIPSVLFEQGLAGGRMALALGGFPLRLRPVPASRASRFGCQAFEHFKKIPVPKGRLRAEDAVWFPAFRNMAPAGAASRLLLDRANAEIDVGFAHGDLGPGNMLADGPDGVFLFDWENASMQAPVQVDSVGLWLACRQRQILRSPQAMARAMKMHMGAPSGNAVLFALAFLCAHGNLAAAKILEGWE